MPKKAAKNAYYYFMLEFREEQRRKGFNYPSMKEVQQAADPIWAKLSSTERARYDAIAKKEKADTKKYTSQGEPISFIESKEKEAQEMEDNEQADIKNFVTKNSVNQQILEEYIYLIDVNAYCELSGGNYLFAECTILRFSLRGGIEEHYPIAINPGQIPLGYAADVQDGVKELYLQPPDPSGHVTNYITVLSHIMDFMKQDGRDKQFLPPVYTMPEKVEQVQDFLMQLCAKAGEQDLFRVYKLDSLFFELINAVKWRAADGLPKKSLATMTLRRDTFEFTQGIACKHHEATDGPSKCTTSRVRRWAFTVLDSTCPVAGIDLVPGYHLPDNYDVSSILKLKEERSERPKPSVAWDTASSSASEPALPAQPEASKPKEKKTHTHVPLRMPKTNYSASFWQPAELTAEGAFPSLGAARGRGQGRGRGSTNDLPEKKFGQMNLN